MAGLLTETLIHLHPARLDGMCGAQCFADVVGPDIGGETIMAVIGHADRIGLVAPRDGHEHRAKDLLARQAPVIRGVGEQSRDRKIPLAQRSLLWRHAAKYQKPLLALDTLVDIGTDFVELL